MSLGATIARELGEWCASLRWHDVPPNVRDSLPLRLLDTVGLIIGAARSPAGMAALDFARAQGGEARCSVACGTEKLPASMAALVHGIEAHCHDFDDTFQDSVVHPGSVVIPTALAVAEARRSPPEAFGLACIIGYEIAARVGAVAERRFHARSLHPSGIVGPIAAAATAGSLLGLSADQYVWAMGLAASMSGGLRAFAVDGGWSKWLHVGWAAHGGVIAAELAARGFRGPEHVFAGGHDLYSALLHGDVVDRSMMTNELGRTWLGALAVFKYYPCAHVIQPYISALLTLIAQHSLVPSNMEKIECTIAPWAAAIVCEPRAAKLRPKSQLEATGSLFYQLASAVCDKGVSLSSIAPGSWERTDVLRFAERIFHQKDSSLGRDFDGVLRIQRTNGDDLVATASAEPADR